VIRSASANRFPHFMVISDMIPSSADWRQYAKHLEAEARAKI